MLAHYELILNKQDLHLHNYSLLCASNISFSASFSVFKFLHYYRWADKDSLLALTIV